MAQVDSENSTAAPTKPIAEAPESPADALYFPTDVTPEELFEAMGKLRREAEDEIERLIDLLDRTDAFEPLDVGCDEDCKPRAIPEIGYYDEREPSGEDEPSLGRTEAGESFSGGGIADGEEEFATTGREERRPCHRDRSVGGEPVLGSCEEHPNPLNISFNGYSFRGSQVGWAEGNGDDREGDGCADDREDTCEDEGAEHDGREPSLGWTDDEASRGRAPAGTMGRDDYEDAPSTLSKAALARHKQFDRYAVNKDGRDVDSEHGFGPRRLRNLSDRQRAILRPKVDRRSVSL
jgi:hypothetical protein